MDHLSDILSSFFVNPNNIKKHSREKKKIRTEIATQTEIDTVTVQDELLLEKVGPKPSKEEATVKEATVKEATVKEATVKEATVKEATVKEATVKEATVKEATVKEATVKEATVKEATVKEATVKEETVKEELLLEKVGSKPSKEEKTVEEKTVEEKTVEEKTVEEKTVEEKTVEEKTVEEKTVEEKTVEEGKGSIYSNLSSDTTSDEIPELRKYILKPSDFYKRNMMIINKDFENSILILSEILHKLSIMKHVGEIFDSNVYITSTDEHKSSYKQILLNNPHLYFTDMHVKNKLDKLDKVKVKGLNESRSIHIIDNELLSTIDAKEFEYLINNDVLLIIIAKDDDKNAITTYDLLTSNKILIHKLYGLKTIQKNFYKIFIKYICKEQVSTFENYYKMINDENLDIKYLILKNDELRYN
jgi:hypothetical protein